MRLTNGATTLEFNDFETNLGGWTVGPPPAGTDNPTNGWERRTEQFKEGGVVATDDTLYTGFGFEGINESARNEFMKRTLTHLGVLAPAPPPGGSNTGTVVVGGTVPPGAAPTTPAKAKAKHARAKIKSSRNLKASRKGVVSVRVRCEGDAGATCAGTLKLARGKASYGSKRFSIKAGKTATVKLTLSKSARKALKAKRTVKATLTASGKDSAGARIATRQSVRLK